MRHCMTLMIYELAYEVVKQEKITLVSNCLSLKAKTTIAMHLFKTE